MEIRALQSAQPSARRWRCSVPKTFGRRVARHPPSTTAPQSRFAKILVKRHPRRPLPPDERLGDERHSGAHGDPARRQRAVSGALDLSVELAVENVVIGAAGAAHGYRADQEQQKAPEVWPSMGGEAAFSPFFILCGDFASTAATGGVGVACSPLFVVPFRLPFWGPPVSWGK